MLRKTGDAPSAALPELRGLRPRPWPPLRSSHHEALRAPTAGPAKRDGQRACGPSSNKGEGDGRSFVSGSNVVASSSLMHM
ncbi:hypothetical protein GCM10010293_62580 [Streptomyces griseoflavus]|nr:hypothetical protein GCM10010293_62580 [Streptomyces griseoflavus]